MRKTEMHTVYFGKTTHLLLPKNAEALGLLYVVNQPKVCFMVKEFRPLDVTRFRPLRGIARFYYARPFGFSRNGLAAEEINATK